MVNTLRFHSITDSIGLFGRMGQFRPKDLGPGYDQYKDQYLSGRYCSIVPNISSVKTIDRTFQDTEKSF